MHAFDMLHMQHRREDAVNGLRARPVEEVKAIFDECDKVFARCDAIKAQDWQLYLELGGNPAVVPARWS